jgi:hypothetical protein
VRAKNVTKTRSIGEAPLSIVNFPMTRNERRMIAIPTITPTIREARSVISTHAPSYFGGPRSSSVVSLSMFSIVSDIGEKEEKCSN